MNRLLRIIALFGFSLVILFFDATGAQAIELSGYYENTFLPESDDAGNSKLLDASKLRLDFNYYPEEGELGFTGNVNYYAYHTGVTYDVSQYLPQAVTDTLNEWDVPAVITFDQNRMLLDNAYLTWDKRPFRLRLGRQQLSWGTGYSFNPTDLFHKKDMTDPTYEKEGVTAIRADVAWGVGNRITGVMIPDLDFERAGYCLRVATHVEQIGYDIALTFHQISDSTSLHRESLLPIAQRRRAAGFDLSGTFLGLGVWAEGNYNRMAAEDDFSRVVGGFDYTLKNGLYVMAEAFYDGRSSSAEAPYDALDWLEYLQFGEPVAQWRFMAGAKQSLSDLIEGSLYVFAGLDESYLINPRLDISAAQNADVAVFGVASFGRENGQFPPGNFGLTVRTTVYF